MNPMNEAWTLLKGNPSMRDAEDRPINHPAAMVYDSLASRLEDQRREMRRRRARGALHPRFPPSIPPTRTTRYPREALSDMAERMSKPTHQNLVREGKTGMGTREARERDYASSRRLRDMRRDARDEVSHDMAQPDPEAGPNYGIGVSTGTDARMKQGNIMEQM